MSDDQPKSISSCVGVLPARCQPPRLAGRGSEWGCVADWLLLFGSTPTHDRVMRMRVVLTAADGAGTGDCVCGWPTGRMSADSSFKWMPSQRP